MKAARILIVGAVNDFSLERSYENAATELQLTCLRFDPGKEIQKHMKFGKVGRLIYNFFSVDVWTRKMNRDLVVRAKEEQPDILLVVGGSRILYGTLITIKLICPGCKVVWVWPDTPMNLSANMLDCARVFDLSATYSSATVPVYQSLGFKNVQWIPLAGDLSMHWNDRDAGGQFDCDISFVGMWRPERERFMKIVDDNFSHLRIEIFGSYWKRQCESKKLLNRWKGNGFYASALSDYFNRSRINVNIIDDTNYPAANMRFFEIPTAGGLQLCSACPEFEKEFRDKEDIVYFRNEKEIVEGINWILSDESRANVIRKSAQNKIRQEHNYGVRLRTILNTLNYNQA